MHEVDLLSRWLTRHSLQHKYQLDTLGQQAQSGGEDDLTGSQLCGGKHEIDSAAGIHAFLSAGLSPVKASTDRALLCRRSIVERESPRASLHAPAER